MLLITGPLRLKVPVNNKKHGRVRSKHPFLLPHVSAAALVSTCALGPGQIRDELLSLPINRAALGDVPLDAPLLLAHGYTDAVPETGRARKKTTTDSVIVFSWTPAQCESHQGAVLSFATLQAVHV